VVAWVAEDIPRLRRLDPRVPAALAEVSEGGTSGAGFREDAGVGVSVAQTEVAFDLVAASAAAAAAAVVVVVVATVALANRMAMHLLTPQLDQDLTAVSGAIVTVTVTVTEVGMAHGPPVAHMMTDPADRLRVLTIEIGGRAPISNLSVTAASTATATAPETMTTGNVAMKVATRTHENSAATRSPLIETTLAVLVGMCYLPVFRTAIPTFFTLLPTFCHQG
jgi:hypothetical protein